MKRLFVPVAFLCALSATGCTTLPSAADGDENQQVYGKVCIAGRCLEMSYGVDQQSNNNLEERAKDDNPNTN